MKLQSVALDLIDIPPVRITAQYDEDLAKLLHESLEATGQIQPIVLVKNGERYELVDGLHRLQEARGRGEARISSVVYEGDQRKTLVLNLVSNRLRGKTRASEMVAVIAELVGKYQMDSDAIRKETGLPREYIEKLWRISEAAPGVKEALDAEVIGVGVAYEIARLPQHIQQEELVARATIWKLSVKDCHDFVDEVLRQMELLKEELAPAVRPAPPPLSCEGCKATPEPRYLRFVPLCPNCFGVVFRMAREREQEEKAQPPAEVEAPAP